MQLLRTTLHVTVPESPEPRIKAGDPGTRSFQEAYFLNVVATPNSSKQ
jgi:hypothetical protein